MENKPVSLSTKEIYEFFYKEAEKLVRSAAKAEEKDQANKAVLFKAMAGHIFGAIKPLFTQSEEVIATHLPHMMICHGIAEDLKKFINAAPEKALLSDAEAAAHAAEPVVEAVAKAAGTAAVDAALSEAGV